MSNHGNPFFSTDSNGVQHEWSLVVDPSLPSEISLRVLHANTPEWYEARFVAISDGVFRPDILMAHDAVFKRKGITTAVFRHVAEDLGKRLKSSKVSSPGESLSPEMRLIWEHYMKIGYAAYNPQDGRYEWVAPKPSPQKKPEAQ